MVPAPRFECRAPDAEIRMADACQRGIKLRKNKPLSKEGLSNLERIGAGTTIRTRDLLITNQLLYQLSYAG